MTSKRIKDATGQKFGYWTVIEPVGTKDACITYRCQCKCGFEREIKGSDLRSGNTKMCKSCAGRKYNATHGYTAGRKYVSEYKAWCHMNERCYSPSCSEYKNYGGRGITVYDKWRKSFESFIADVGMKPSPNYSLDRIDVNGNYEPGNVRWTTWDVQNRNRRTNIMATINGETQCLMDWSRKFNIPGSTLRQTMHRLNVSLEEAIVYQCNKRGIDICDAS